MGFVLDCEGGESTVESLSECFGCEQSEFVSVLQSIDIETIYSDFESSPDVAAEEYLYDYVVSQLGEPDETESVCWFHLTRTLGGNDFSDGILPLSDVLDSVWETLFSIFEGSNVCENLKDMRNNGVDDFQYNLKSGDPVHAGPYGILVREIACNASELGQHDYLEFPEIVEDICAGYERTFGEAIYEGVSAALVPCVVKFSEGGVAARGAIEAALFYAYTYSNGLPVSVNSVWCFDGEDCAVPYDDITYVEFLDDGDC